MQQQAARRTSSAASFGCPARGGGARVPWIGFSSAGGSGRPASAFFHTPRPSHSPLTPRSPFLEPALTRHSREQAARGSHRPIHVPLEPLGSSHREGVDHPAGGVDLAHAAAGLPRPASRPVRTPGRQVERAHQGRPGVHAPRSRRSAGSDPRSRSRRPSRPPPASAPSVPAGADTTTISWRNGNPSWLVKATWKSPGVDGLREAVVTEVHRRDLEQGCPGDRPGVRSERDDHEGRDQGRDPHRRRDHPRRGAAALTHLHAHHRSPDARGTDDPSATRLVMTSASESRLTTWSARPASTTARGIP